MLRRSHLQDVWHEGCGRVADTPRGEVECCITPRDHDLSVINLIKHADFTNSGQDESYIAQKIIAQPYQ